MAEVLSQSQIDALLNSMHDSGDGQKEAEPGKKKESYRKYDFYSPKKFTKDKLKILQGIYDNFSRITSSRLNGILRLSTEFKVLAVEEQRYYEFNNGLSDDDIISLTELKLQDDSKNPPLIIHINQVLMVNMIDRMLGGLGNDSQIDSSYAYTEIELPLYMKMMQHILSGTREAWNNYIKLDIGELRLEENPSLFQEVSLEEPVAIIMLEVKMESIEGIISVCIPGNLLDSIFSIIERRKNIESDYAQDANRTRASILSKVKESALTVRAELGEAQVSLQDVCGLKVGDVLDLNKSKEASLSLFVGDEPWFEGTAGVYKKNVAIKINKRIDHEEDNETAQTVSADEVEQVPEFGEASPEQVTEEPVPAAEPE